MAASKYDIVLVGTGFSTTFFLHSYLERAPGNARVLVLERGFLFPHAERLKAARGEETAFAAINEPSSETFINATGKQWRFQTGFGGSSNCWYACTPRLMPNDFHMRTLYGVATDWPVDYDDLEEYYGRAEDLMSISGPADTPFPRSRPYPQPPHLLTPVDEVLSRRFGNLYISQPTARARVAVNGRAACCANAVCSTCPVNAKFTIENSGLGVYEDPRVELRTGAQVYALELQGSTAHRALFRTRDGRDEAVEGEVFALGANAFFNAHILRNSGDSNPFTGRGLGEQHAVQATVLLDGISNVGGSTWVNANGYMLYDGEHRRTAAACLIEANNAPYFRLKRGRWRDMARFRMIFESLPDEMNMVEPSEDLLRPRVTHHGPGEYVDAGIRRMRELLPELLSDLPVEDILFDQVYSSESHILGTTRMSPTAETGVIDRHLIHHQYRNLFVLGGGGFPTYSPANPTLTICAHAMFAADRTFGAGGGAS